MKTTTMMALAGALAFAAPAAAETVKIGMVTTLSTGAGYLGEDVRDGFLLAVKEEGGKLGGTDVEVLVEDDGRKPGTGRQIAQRFIERDGVEIMTGVIFSNISPVVWPLAEEAGIFYVTPNSAPSAYAGAGCHEDYFAVAWQNDSLHESVGVLSNDLGHGNAFIMAANYQAGKDAIAGFKRYFKGEIVGELYPALGQTDYAAEIAAIRDAKPAMVYHFLPGGMGINFIKQYAQAGLGGTIPQVLSGAGMESRILGAVGETALNVASTSHWSADFDNEANKAFVAGFEAEYGRLPSVYASQGYDTAKLIASALKATGGKVLEDKDGFRNAMRAADFASVRGEFRFNNNQHPINDWINQVVEKDADGALVLRSKGIVAPALADAYAGECALDWNK
ncbi:MAG: ABC transporter substrate-binding protein [Pseudomonadota bacterium]